MHRALSVLTCNKNGDVCCGPCVLATCCVDCDFIAISVRWIVIEDWYETNLKKKRHLKRSVVKRPWSFRSRIKWPWATFLIECTLILWSRDFYRVIVDEGKPLNNFQAWNYIANELIFESINLLVAQNKTRKPAHVLLFVFICRCTPSDYLAILVTSQIAAFEIGRW